MYNEDLILQELNATNLAAEEKQEVLDQVAVRVGEAIGAQLTDAQRNEYQAIVDANQDVISAWLDQNMPDYKDSPIYQEVAAGFETDPEKIQPEKVVASIGWVEVNIPNANEVVAQVVAAYKQERGAGEVSVGTPAAAVTPAPTTPVSNLV